MYDRPDPWMSKTVFVGYGLRTQGSTSIPLHTAPSHFLTQWSTVPPTAYPIRSIIKRRPLYCLAHVIHKLMALPKGDSDPIKCACLLACLLAFPLMPVHDSRHDKKKPSHKLFKLATFLHGS